ncbi:cation transporter, partial [Klebsiella michiganensis]|nr:cation transporter [Klebsiella michiganensis]
MNASTESCGCHGEPARAQTDPAYRRALLTVVVLNLGFGVAELFGG